MEGVMANMEKEASPQYLIRLTDAIDRYGLSRSTFDKAHKEGHVRKRKLARAAFVDTREIEAWINAGPAEPEQLDAKEVAGGMVVVGVAVASVDAGEAYFIPADVRTDVVWSDYLADVRDSVESLYAASVEGRK
jgi:predicted DNA-binding transcriptional regulator AlpA